MDTNPILTDIAAIKRITKKHLSSTDGLIRLLPTWVPRTFLTPGKRLRLHPDDYYAYGERRGGIDERWLASTTLADNENATKHEGLSTCSIEGNAILLADVIAANPTAIIGPSLQSTYSRWPVLCKLFDNKEAIPLHIHQTEQYAAYVQKETKPEAYYYPPEYNETLHSEPYTYFGLKEDVTKQQITNCLHNWEQDNDIRSYSNRVDLQIGTGWLVAPGVLHAPGSLCTYEPQWGSDVFSMFQNTVGGRRISKALLTKDYIKEKQDDMDYIVDSLDWDKNTSLALLTNNYLEPLQAASGPGWQDDWIVYGCINNTQYFSAKRLTLEPGATCTIKDTCASGWLTVRGKGAVGSFTTEAPTSIRFGEPTLDEFFISFTAANTEITIRNTGTEPLVALRHFGPDMKAPIQPLV